MDTENIEGFLTNLFSVVSVSSVDKCHFPRLLNRRDHRARREKSRFILFSVCSVTSVAHNLSIRPPIPFQVSPARLSLSG